MKSLGGVASSLGGMFWLVVAIFTESREFSNLDRAISGTIGIALLIVGLWLWNSGLRHERN